MSNKLKILVCPANQGGCAYYRAILPARKLQELFPDQVEVRTNYNPLGIFEEGEKRGTFDPDYKYEDLKWADIVWTNNLSNWGGPYTARLVGKAKEFGKFVHYDTDDLLTDLYEDHRLHKTYTDQNLGEITKFIYNHADLTTVTQKKFAARVKPFCGGVLAVVKNSIDYNLPCWNQPKIIPRNKNLMRIGWAGGIHHEADIKEFVGIPNLVNQKAGRENVYWGFYGCPSPPKPGEPEDWQHEVWRNYKKIILAGFKGKPNWQIYNAIHPDHYGGIYSNMDIAIAPLQMNNFNDSKSEIKVAECGRYGVPLIASNVGCYDETIINGKTGYLIPHDAPKSEWVRILTKCIKNPKHVKEMGQNLKKVTDEYFDINKVAKYRMELYDQAISMVVARDKDREFSFNTTWSFEE